MKVKIVVIISLLLGAALIAGCGSFPGLGSNSNTPPSTPVGPINSNYSNAISPAQQLILGTMNLQGNLEVTPNEAAQLVPLWEAYQTLSTSNTASPLELQATLVGVEQAMTPDQVQAIVNMKLTRQDMATIFQQQGISFGGRGGSGTPACRWWRIRWRRRWIRGGGLAAVAEEAVDSADGGFGGGASTPNPQVIATYRARASSGAANAGLVRLVIQFLQQKILL